MKKLLLFLCLSTSLTYAMDQNLPITNTLSVNIDSPSLGDTIVDTLGHSGVIVLETDNNPDDNFFTVMRAIVQTQNAQREARIQREARMHEYKQYTATIITLGVLAAFTILKNING